MEPSLKIEKYIARPASEVFRFLKEGRLFANCSANTDTIQIDFRVGGKYYITFNQMNKSNFGVFTEIIPNKKIAFTWCQQFGVSQKPDTQVTIDLFEDGPKTRLVLTHVGFKDQSICDLHYAGWNGGLTDLISEIEQGRMRIVRSFNAPIEKLYATCKNPETFFAFMGDVTRGNIDVKVGGQYQIPTKKGEVKGQFIELVPNTKMKLSWLMGCSGKLENSFVTLNFKTKEDGNSSLELIHEGLNTEDEQKSHRGGWEHVVQKVAEVLNDRK
jgi:uncharacterized protein YndB with AHSA1/START domain